MSTALDEKMKAAVIICHCCVLIRSLFGLSFYIFILESRFLQLTIFTGFAKIFENRIFVLMLVVITDF